MAMRMLVEALKGKIAENDGTLTSIEELRGFESIIDDEPHLEHNPGSPLSLPLSILS